MLQPLSHICRSPCCRMLLEFKVSRQPLAIFSRTAVGRQGQAGKMT